MDALDYQILKILKENARAKASDISRQVHLSVSTVLERIRKMETGGVITAYTVLTDESRMGSGVTAQMEVSLEHPKYSQSFEESVLAHPHIVSCYYLTGEFDYLLKITCRSSEHLEQIHRFIKEREGISKTLTHYVLRTVKNIYSSLPAEDDNIL